MAGLVGIIMGSPSDSECMNNCVDILEQEGIPFDYIVASAHRDPDKVKEWVEEAEQRGNKVIIAAAGMAAALPGVCAAYTSLPVIGVPMSSELNGMRYVFQVLEIDWSEWGNPTTERSVSKFSERSGLRKISREL